MGCDRQLVPMNTEREQPDQAPDESVPLSQTPPPLVSTRKTSGRQGGCYVFGDSGYDCFTRRRAPDGLMTDILEMRRALAGCIRAKNNVHLFHV